ncbi:SCO2322 family protein [Streptomyces sp. enrichment culture]|uniref:SCO2322 family protein n=1 Tax=Streptomyces sp. enrichment culture TaxID=1795815 RepID=UPI003F54C8E8
MIRRLTVLLLAALVPLAAVLAGAGPAQAVGYRYWSFWERDGGQWTYATQGPSTARPADGDVQGFRFSVSEDSGDAATPRGAADFDTICADTPAQDGRKRVALVIDFGTAADAPSGERPPERRTACARVAGNATTAQALAAVAEPLRYNTNALLCAIEGYPTSGCGEQVSGTEADRESPQGPDRTGEDPSAAGRDGSESSGTSSASDASDGDGGGTALGLAAGIALVALLGGAAVWQVRRRG